MKLSEHDRDEVRLRALLRDTFPERQRLIHSKANVTVIRTHYPALFTADGLVQDYLQQSPANTGIMQVFLCSILGYILLKFFYYIYGI